MPLGHRPDAAPPPFWPRARGPDRNPVYLIKHSGMGLQTRSHRAHIRPAKAGGKQNVQEGKKARRAVAGLSCLAGVLSNNGLYGHAIVVIPYGRRHFVCCGSTARNGGGVQDAPFRVMRQAHGKSDGGFRRILIKIGTTECLGRVSRKTGASCPKAPCAPATSHDAPFKGAHANREKVPIMHVTDGGPLLCNLGGDKTKFWTVGKIGGTPLFCSLGKECETFACIRYGLYISGGARV
jgi:hypothetical protein